MLVAFYGLSVQVVCAQHAQQLGVLVWQAYGQAQTVAVAFQFREPLERYAFLGEPLRHALRVLEAGHHEVAETGQHSGADGQLGNGGGYFAPLVDEGAAPGVYVIVGFLPVSRRLPVRVVCAEECACLLQRPHRLGRGDGKAERLLIGALAVHAAQDNNAPVLAQQRQQGGLAGEVEQAFVHNGKAFEALRYFSCPLCADDAAQHTVRVTKQQEFAAVVLCGFNGVGIGREVRGDVRAAIFHVVEPCQPQPRLVAGAGKKDIWKKPLLKSFHQINWSLFRFLVTTKK